MGPPPAADAPTAPPKLRKRPMNWRRKTFFNMADDNPTAIPPQTDRKSLEAPHELAAKNILQHGTPTSFNTLHGEFQPAESNTASVYGIGRAAPDSR